MRIASIGNGLGKTTFHLVALGERNEILLPKKFSRTQLLAYTANLPVSVIGLGACAGARFVGAAPREQGNHRAGDGTVGKSWLETSRDRNRIVQFFAAYLRTSSAERLAPSTDRLGSNGTIGNMSTAPG